MNRRISKKLKPLLFLFLVLVLAAIAFNAFQREKPFYVHALPDGSRFEILNVTSGKTVMFFVGLKWQEPLFQYFGTNLPPLLRGNSQIAASRFNSGSIGFTMRATLSQYEFQQSQFWKFFLVGASGKQTEAIIRHNQLTMPETADGKIILNWLYELPQVSDSTLRFRYFPNRYKTNFAEFTIPNPMPQ